MGAHPKIREDLIITPLETSCREQMYLIETPEGQKFQISSQLYQLIQLLDGRKNLDSIAVEFFSQSGKLCTPEDIATILERYLEPYGLIENLSSQYNGKEEKGEGKSQNTPKFLYFKIPLFSQKFLSPLTNILNHLFRPEIFIPLFLMGLLVPIWGIIHIQIRSLFHQQGWVIPFSYLFLICTFLIHELGHASACKRYGCSHGSIGFGLYLTFPVFYTDVNEAWRLPPNKRAVIDMGGIYFQSIFGLILFIVYYLTKFPLLILGIYLLYMSVFINLNPFFRFDGYWLLSDLLKIPNLRQRSRGLLRYLGESLILRRGKREDLFLQLRPWAQFTLWGYTVLSNVFFLFFIYRFIKFAPNFFRNYPAVLAKSLIVIWESALNFNVLGVFKGILQIALPTFVLFSFYLLLRSLGIKLFRFLKAKLRPGIAISTSKIERVS